MGAHQPTFSVRATQRARRTKRAKEGKPPKQLQNYTSRGVCMCVYVRACVSVLSVGLGLTLLDIAGFGLESHLYFGFGR